MKNLSLILNIILIIAVAFLFYKVYSEKESAMTRTEVPADASIVFVNSDSLLDNYKYFIELKTVMEKKSDSIDMILKSKARELDSQIQLYQKQSIGMTDMEKQSIEEKLMEKQQGLMQMKQDMMGMLADEEATLNDSIHTNLVNYLKEFNKQRKYHYILGYQKGGGILLANDSLDITNEVLEGLNNQ